MGACLGTVRLGGGAWCQVQAGTLALLDRCSGTLCVQAGMAREQKDLGEVDTSPSVAALLEGGWYPHCLLVP